MAMGVLLGSESLVALGKQAVNVHLHASADDARFGDAECLVCPGVAFVVGLESHC